MARILLAVDFDIEARWLEDLIRGGHDIVDRVTGADALAAQVLEHRPDLTLVQAGPETLTPASLRACDAAGTRTIAVVADELERRHAAALGIVDRADARESWAQIERTLVAGGGPAAAQPQVGASGAGIAAGDAAREPGVPGMAAPGLAAPGMAAPGAAASDEPPMSRRELRRRREAGKRGTGHAEGRGTSGPAAAMGRAGEGMFRHVTAALGPIPPSPAPGSPAPASAGPGPVVPVPDHPGAMPPFDTATMPAAWNDAPPLAVPSPGREPAHPAAMAAPDGAAPARAALGRVVAVWGPHGAPGATTIAIGLAGAAAAAGQRVILVDADSYGGAVAAVLGLADEAPGFAAACRLAGAESLTPAELDRVSSTSRAASPFRVLAGIVNPGRWPELGRDRVRGALDVCRQVADLVIVDVGFNLETDEELLSDIGGPRRNAATLSVLDAADTVVAVVEASPVGIPRFLRARQSLDDRLGPHVRIHTVANRVRTTSGADAGGQVRDALRRFGGIEEVWLLPDDAKACDRALGLGVPVGDAAPRSVLARRLRDLAARLQ